MAKVAFSKLKCKINDTEVPVQIGEETVMVKQYLSIQEKLALMERVIEYAHDQNKNYNNPVKVDVYTAIELIRNYTNIELSDIELDNPPMLYDILISSELYEKILAAIPEEEKETIKNGIIKSIQAVYQYQNSLMGIMENLKQDYSVLSEDIETLQEDLHDPEALGLLKTLLTNFG